jgi:hypothetical protein
VVIQHYPFPAKTSPDLIATFLLKRGKKWQKVVKIGQRLNLPPTTKPYKLNDLSGLEEGGQNRVGF